MIVLEDRIIYDEYSAKEFLESLGLDKFDIEELGKYLYWDACPVDGIDCDTECPYLNDDVLWSRCV